MLVTLKKLVVKLRDKTTGDPWIIEQDFKSLIPKTLEESYELADSIEKGNYKEVRDELADLLLHIVLYAEMAHEKALFDFNDIAQAALDKQSRRKLEFPDPTQITAQEALLQWEKNKKKEREDLHQNRSVLDDVSLSLPAIHRSLKLQHQAASVGFDWPDEKPVFEKILEEIDEIKEELQTSNTKENVTDELGDLFFSCVALARHLAIDPELALRHANNKFEKRFRLLEQEVKSRGKKLEDLSLEEMDRIWEQIKKITV